MTQIKGVGLKTAIFAAAAALSLLAPPLFSALPVAAASIILILFSERRAAPLRFICAMMLPLAGGMWLVHGGIFASWVSGVHTEANYGAIGLWLRILAVVCAGQAWLAYTGTEALIRAAFCSKLPPKLAFLLASPLLITEQIKRRVEQIREAQTARGVNLSGSLRERGEALLAMLFPLVMSLLTDLPARSAALDMKGFGLSGIETLPRKEGVDALSLRRAVLGLPGGEPLLEAPSFTLKAGEAALIEGGSGSGKSALAILLAGGVPEYLNASFSGMALLFGKPIPNTLRLSPHLQYVQQNPVMSLSGCAFTVFDEIAFSLKNMRIPDDEISVRVSEALRLTEIESLAERNPSELSGGELQKCTIACALAVRPALLILDEAFTRIYLPDKIRMLEKIDEWSRAHNVSMISMEQRERCQRKGTRWHLIDGRLIEGTPPPECSAWPQYAAAPGGETMAEFKGLSFAWRGTAKPLLSDISLSVERGERIALTGANGAGKSTLLRLTAGLLRPSSGTVLIMGEDAGRLTAPERAKRTAFLFQDSERQIFHSTVFDEVIFSLRASDAAEDDKRRRVMETLKMLELEGKERLHPLDLSSSDRRMTGVASIAAGNYDLILLDEPTRDMDEAHQHIFENWLARQSASVIAISHDPDFIERAFTKKLLLEGGQLRVL